MYNKYDISTDENGEYIEALQEVKPSDWSINLVINSYKEYLKRSAEK